MRNEADIYAAEDAIDAWHDGYFAHDTARNPHADPLLRHEWEEGRRQRGIDQTRRVAVPERPEGYYHSRLPA